MKVATNTGKPVDPLKGASKDVKKILSSLGKLPPMGQDEIEKLLQAIALGLIPDKFGMDASLDTRIRALTELNKMREEKTLDVNINTNPLKELSTEELRKLADKL